MEQNRRVIRIDRLAVRLLVERLTPFLGFCGDDDRIQACYDAAVIVAGVEK
jgi:hypothetical protein